MAISHADVPVGKDLVPSGSGEQRAGQRRTGDDRQANYQNRTLGFSQKKN